MIDYIFTFQFFIIMWIKDFSSEFLLFLGFDQLIIQIPLL